MARLQDNLLSAREKAGLSREETALKMRTTPERVSRWENGQERPDTESLFELSALFRVPPHQLIAEEVGKDTSDKLSKAGVSPALDDFRRELVAMREVDLLPLDDETIDYCVGAMRARLAPDKS